MKYKIVIGLEIHVELLTSSKLFCSCSSEFGKEPNTLVCPVCFGLPGSLPVLNQAAVTQAVRAALALECRINETSIFARKNYFYPDLPKGYQITQDQHPLAEGGGLDSGGNRVSISRLHIEEDSGKLVHGPDSTLVDFNRSGIPLVEIVTTPCISSPAQARLFLEKLKQILEYTNVSDCKMEEGSLRCDANISLQPFGSPGLGTRTEIKNLNSFKAIELALEYEIQRQHQLLILDEEILFQTLRWDENKNITVPMRFKEQAHDYRYFPEPDLLPLRVDKEMITRNIESLPQLPQARQNQYIRKYGISENNAMVLTRTKGMADWFEQTVLAGAEPQQAANWLIGEVSRLQNRGVNSLLFKPQDLARLIELHGQGEVSGVAAKQVLAEMLSSGLNPEVIIQNRGLAQLNDTSELENLVERVISEYPVSVADYNAGRVKALGFLVGQAMKLSQGQANPALLKEIFSRKL